MTGHSRRLRLDLSYDGVDFHGWQVQPGQRTVQGTLEQCLSRIQGGAPVKVRGAGRTDSGAHARAQVADCEVHTRLDDGRLLHALRGLLPSDLRLHALRRVAPGFDARAAATDKTYRYQLDRSPGGNPFLARYALHVPGPLDVRRLTLACNRLPGRRDWTPFAASKCEIKNRVRRLLTVSYAEAGESRAWFTFTGEGFLTHMVRNLVGLLLDIGRGRQDLERVAEILEGRDAIRRARTPPARGLFLWCVRYPPDPDAAAMEPPPPEPDVV